MAERGSERDLTEAAAGSTADRFPRKRGANHRAGSQLQFLGGSSELGYSKRAGLLRRKLSPAQYLC
jgi:hypothetical protein